MSVAVQLAQTCRCAVPLVDDGDCAWCGKPIETPDPYVPSEPDEVEVARRARSREYSRKARLKRTPEQIAREREAERQRKFARGLATPRCVSGVGTYGKHDFVGGLSATCVRCGAANTAKRVK